MKYCIISKASESLTTIRSKESSVFYIFINIWLSIRLIWYVRGADEQVWVCHPFFVALAVFCFLWSVPAFASSHLCTSHYVFSIWYHSYHLSTQSKVSDTFSRWVLCIRRSWAIVPLLLLLLILSRSWRNINAEHHHTWSPFWTLACLTMCFSYCVRVLFKIDPAAFLIGVDRCFVAEWTAEQQVSGKEVRWWDLVCYYLETWATAKELFTVISKGRWIDSKVTILLTG